MARLPPSCAGGSEADEKIERGGEVGAASKAEAASQGEAAASQKEARAEVSVEGQVTQSRRISLLEANTNAVVGLVVSWLFTFFCLPLFGLTPTAGEAAGITSAYFLLSVARGYVIRRVFNRWWR